MIYSYSKVFDNGLKLICSPMANTEQVNMTFVFHNVGHSTDPKPGLAHLAEHLVFAGTNTMSAKGIASKLNNLTGNSYTAYTAYAETIFSADVNKDKVSDAIKMWVDMFTNSTCDALNNEKKIIGHELDLRLDNHYVKLFNLAEKSYGLENQDILHKFILPSITQSDVSNFIKANYVPNNCTLYISGNIEKQRILEAKVEEYTKNWKKLAAENKLPVLKYNPSFTVEKASANSVYCGLIFEGAKVSDTQSLIAQCIVNAISGAGLDSTPMLDARINKGLAYNVDTLNVIESNHGLWGLTSATDKSAVKELMKSMMTSVKSLLPSITNDNVACARIALKNQIDKPSLTPVAVTMNARFYDELGISKEKFIEDIDNITTDQVKAFFNKTIDSKPSVVLYGNVDNYSEGEFSAIWESIDTAA